MRRYDCAPPRRQRGVAMLVAILIVALGTVLATSIAFDSVMAARRGIATMALDQSFMVATGAEALAAYALREDLRDGQDEDHAGEAWAQPYGPLEVMDGVVLTASLTDVQGRFNLNSLVGKNGKVNPSALAQFERLLEMLELEPRWAAQIADWIDRDNEPLGTDGGEDALYSTQNPPYRAPNLLITSTSELLALPGFGRERYLKLAPHITALPWNERLNLCSASGFVLDSLVPNYREYSLMEPEELAEIQQNECQTMPDRIRAAFGGDENGFKAVRNRIGTTSNYFRLTTIVSIGTSEFALYSLLQRERQRAGGNVRPIMRNYAGD